MGSFDKISNEKTQRPIPPADVCAAICYGVIAMGTHTKTFKGEEKQSMVLKLLWELPDYKAVFEEGKGEQRMVVSQDYNLFTDEKSNLMKMLYSWYPKLKEQKSFDIEKVLKGIVGKSCRLIVIHNKSKDGNITYANVSGNGTGVLPAVEKGAAANYGEPTNETIFFDLLSENFNWDEFNALPSYIKKKMQSSLEWSGIIAKHGQHANAEAKADTKTFTPSDNGLDLPF